LKEHQAGQPGAVGDAAEGLGRPDDAETGDDDDDGPGGELPGPQPRPDVLHQDRVIEEDVGNRHQETSIAPILMNSSSRPSLWGAKAATRTPPWTSRARRSLA